ncbi:MAG TPA: hypothetical protein VH540_04200 [Ktedonobacterales bacterium]|jgi:hypothetical protein
MAQIPDDVYTRLVRLAQATGQKPETLLDALVTQAEQDHFKPTGHISYSDEEWMRHLGMDEEDIAWVQAQPVDLEPGEEYEVADS